MSEKQPYLLELSAKAELAFRKLDKPVARHIGKRLKWLAAHAESHKHIALTGQWRGFYCFRIGDYRAIYRLDLEERVISLKN